MIGSMRRALVHTGVFALLVFVGFLLFGGSSPLLSLAKTLVVAAVFCLYQLWVLRRQARRGEGVTSDGS
jgi:hypothetical protein